MPHQVSTTRRARRERERRLRAARRYGLLSGAAGVAVAAAATATGLGEGGPADLLPEGDPRSVTGTGYDAHVRGESPAAAAEPTEVTPAPDDRTPPPGRHATDESGAPDDGTPSASTQSDTSTDSDGSSTSPESEGALAGADSDTPGDTTPPSTSTSAGSDDTATGPEGDDAERTTPPSGGWVAAGSGDDEAPDPSGESSTTPGTDGTGTPAPSTADGEDATVRQRILALVNAERERAGCQPLRLNDALAEVSDAHAEDMRSRGYFAHDGLDGRSAFERIADAGYDYALAAENIARGQPTARQVVDAWMASDLHRNNILNCDFEDLGIGYASGVGGPWWVQNFGVRVTEPASQSSGG